MTHNEHSPSFIQQYSRLANPVFGRYLQGANPPDPLLGELLTLHHHNAENAAVEEPFFCQRTNIAQYDSLLIRVLNEAQKGAAPIFPLFAFY